MRVVHSPRSTLYRGQPTHTQHHDGDGEEAAIDREQVLPADEQSPVVPQPREAPFHFVTQPILILARQHRSSAFGSPCGGTALGRDAHLDAPAAPRVTERATIVMRLTSPFQAFACFGAPAPALALQPAAPPLRLGRPTGGPQKRT